VILFRIVILFLIGHSVAQTVDETVRETVGMHGQGGEEIAVERHFPRHRLGRPHQRPSDIRVGDRVVVEEAHDPEPAARRVVAQEPRRRQFAKGCPNGCRIAADVFDDVADRDAEAADPRRVRPGQQVERHRLRVGRQPLLPRPRPEPAPNDPVRPHPALPAPIGRQDTGGCANPLLCSMELSNPLSTKGNPER